MSRPKNSERLRPGTRCIWARRLRLLRHWYGVTQAEVANHFPTPASPATVRKYERVGPPTLKAALSCRVAIAASVTRKFGGIQTDIEQVTKGAKL